MCRTAGSGWNYEATFIYSINAISWHFASVENGLVMADVRINMVLQL